MVWLNQSIRTMNNIYTLCCHLSFAAGEYGDGPSCKAALCHVSSQQRDDYSFLINLIIAKVGRVS
jgi:hypothetical protein